MDSYPLTSESSSGDCNKQMTTSLPDPVSNCLLNARFLHLATAHHNVPHVSLMSYTYLPSGESPYTASPVIIMTTNPSSKKYENLVTNPAVSLLVHDWVYHRPPTTSGRRLSSSAGQSGGAVDPAVMSPMASLLMNMNSSAVSSISATIGGQAKLVEPRSEEDRFYRGKHLENNTFEGQGGGPVFGAGRRDSMVGVGGADGAREDQDEDEEEDVRVIVVGVRDVRISDYKGAVSDYVLVPPGQGDAVGQGGPVNGLP